MYRTAHVTRMALTCPDENISFACRRLMTGQRNWMLSGDLSVSAGVSEREEDARPMWTTAERDFMNRRVWVGSSRDLGMTSIIPMRGYVRTVLLVSSGCTAMDAPKTGGLIEGLVGCVYEGLVAEMGDTMPRNWISSSMARAGKRMTSLTGKGGGEKGTEHTC